MTKREEQLRSIARDEASAQLGDVDYLGVTEVLYDAYGGGFSDDEVDFVYDLILGAAAVLPIDIQLEDYK